jgi:glutamate decarboxylase
VPAYTFPDNRSDLAVLRVVCRNGFSMDMAGLFLADLRAAVTDLQTHAGESPESGPTGFRH